MLRLVLIDSGGRRASVWQRAFAKAGIGIDAFADEAAATRALSAGSADAVIVEVEEDAPAEVEALCGRLRTLLGEIPLLVRLASFSDSERFAAIGAGADEVLPSSAPVSLVVAALQARIRRAARATPPAPPAPPPSNDHRSGRLYRAAFLEQLSLHLRQAPEDGMALISLRLDDAESLSGALGFAAKVDLEQQLAERFAGLLDDREAYSLWIDFGYGILARKRDADGLRRLALAMCKAVAGKPFRLPDGPRALTASAGIALPPRGERDPDRWFAAAHAAQAIARRLGGNRVDGVLDAGARTMPDERVLIIRERVREAAQGRNIEIEFQPMLPVVGEAEPMYALLTRLRDFRAPLQGVVRDEYLGPARDAGAMGLIDRVSLFRALEAIEAQPARAPPVRVLVPFDLRSVDRTQQAWLNAELGRRRKSAPRLALEFDLEDALKRKGIGKAFETLRGIGVRISLDATALPATAVEAALGLPADLLRFSQPRIGDIARDRWLELTEAWRNAGRRLIVDGIDDVATLSSLWDRAVAYGQGQAVAAPGPRLDFDFQREIG